MVHCSPNRVCYRQLEQPGHQKTHKGHEGVLQGGPQGYQLRALHDLQKILHDSIFTSGTALFLLAYTSCSQHEGAGACNNEGSHLPGG